MEYQYILKFLADAIADENERVHLLSRVLQLLKYVDNKSIKKEIEYYEKTLMENNIELPPQPKISIRGAKLINVEMQLTTEQMIKLFYLPYFSRDARKRLKNKEDDYLIESILQCKKFGNSYVGRCTVENYLRFSSNGVSIFYEMTGTGFLHPDGEMDGDWNFMVSIRKSFQGSDEKIGSAQNMKTSGKFYTFSGYGEKTDIIDSEAKKVSEFTKNELARIYNYKIVFDKELPVMVEEN